MSTQERPIIFNTENVKTILNGRKTQTRRVIKLQPIGKFGGISEKFAMSSHCPYGQVGDRLWVRETWRILDDTMLLDDIVRVEYKADGQIIKRRYGDIAWNEQGLDLPVIQSAMKDGKWKPAHHLPHIISQITLEITEVRVERLQEITEEDAIAEGTIKYPTKITQGKVYSALSDYSYEAYPLRWGFKKGERLIADYPSLGLARLYSLDKTDGQCIHLSPKEAFSLLEDEALPYKEAFINLWDSLNAKRGFSWEANPWVWVISFNIAKPD